MENHVKGFFVRVADVTPIKLMEAKVIQLKKTKRIEVLRSVIETREKEKEIIAYELRESVSQTLAYCKPMLQNANSKDAENSLLKEITDHIYRAIRELNDLSNNLSPSGIPHFGLNAELEDYIVNFQKKSGHEVRLTCNDGNFEELSVNDKISIFRIVQNFILLIKPCVVSQKIKVSIKYDAPLLHVLMSYNDLRFELPVFSQEFIDIQNRVEYYEGSFQLIKNAEENALLIELDMTGSHTNKA